MLNYAADGGRPAGAVGGALVVTEVAWATVVVDGRKEARRTRGTVSSEALGGESGEIRNKSSKIK